MDLPSDVYSNDDDLLSSDPYDYIPYVNAKK